MILFQKLCRKGIFSYILQLLPHCYDIELFFTMFILYSFTPDSVCCFNTNCIKNLLCNSALTFSKGYFRMFFLWSANFAVSLFTQSFWFIRVNVKEHWAEYIFLGKWGKHLGNFTVKTSHVFLSLGWGVHVF